MIATTYAHIALNAEGVPYLAGTRIKVKHIALQQVRGGLNAEQIQQQYPNLTLGQIHSALAFYFDHREDMDQMIEADDRLADDLRPHLEDPATIARLRAIKQAPEAQTRDQHLL